MAHVLSPRAGQARLDGGAGRRGLCRLRSSPTGKPMPSAPAVRRWGCTDFKLPMCRELGVNVRGHELRRPGPHVLGCREAVSAPWPPSLPLPFGISGWILGLGAGLGGLGGQWLLHPQASGPRGLLFAMSVIQNLPARVGAGSGRQRPAQGRRQRGSRGLHSRCWTLGSHKHCRSPSPRGRASEGPPRGHTR